MEHFNWTDIEKNWNGTNPPKSKASLKRTDFKSQCEKWLEKYQHKEWVYIRKSNIGNNRSWIISQEECLS